MRLMLRLNFVSSLLLVLLLCAAGLSMMAGDAPISAVDVGYWLAGTGAAMPDMILGEIRAPRVVLAAFTGFVLGLAGAAVQAFLRNPLAEPSLPVSYTHLRAHETKANLVCRLLLEKKTLESFVIS